MLIYLTTMQNERVPVNPDHIVWVEPINGDRPHRKVYHTRGELHVTETIDEIYRLANGQPFAPSLETKAVEADAPSASDSSRAVVEEAIAAEEVVAVVEESAVVIEETHAVEETNTAPTVTDATPVVAPSRTRKLETK